MSKDIPNVTEALKMFSAIRTEYAFDGSVFCKDSHKTKLLKWIMDNRLALEDKLIIQLYAELGSLRELGKILCISKSSAEKQVDRIQNEIKREYEHLLRTIAADAYHNLRD